MGFVWFFLSISDERYGVSRWLCGLTIKLESCHCQSVHCFAVTAFFLKLAGIEGFGQLKNGWCLYYTDLISFL